MTLIAIHLLQNHAPSNLNRDDNGDPKDAMFGGARRARISSQALKRSVRTSPQFQAAFADTSLLGKRTQLLPEQVREQLADYSVSEQERDAILFHARRFGKGDRGQTSTEEGVEEGKGRGKATRGKATSATAAPERLKTAQLMYLSTREVQQLTRQMVELCRTHGPEAFQALETEKAIAEPIRKSLEPHAVDIAMFGRMTTSSPFKDIEAAVQVAHAISTHKVDQEFDYFTAVDDLSGETGAGMIGDVAFNSATYYKYINVHWEGLLSNLAQDRDIAERAVLALLESAMTAIPSGKQNTFAAHNLPDFVLVEVLAKNIPVSYANAFLKAIRPTDEQSLMDRSIAALVSYAAPIPARFDLPMQRAIFPSSSTPEFGAVAHTLPELKSWLQAHLSKVGTV